MDNNNLFSIGEIAKAVGFSRKITLYDVQKSVGVGICNSVFGNCYACVVSVVLQPPNIIRSETVYAAVLLSDVNSKYST